jgi:hypothetical protein
MKILSISCLCLVVNLMLGLFVVCSATAPQHISGNREVAGFRSKCDCADIQGVHCVPLPNDHCGYEFFGCVGTGMDCYKPAPGVAAACQQSGCVPEAMEYCY